MDPKQIEIFEWLKEYSPAVSQIYEAAIKMRNDKNFPGRTYLIAHAGREICNRLPEIISGQKIDRVKYDKELKPIIDEWEKKGLNSINLVGDDRESVEIPNHLVIKLNKVFEAHKGIEGSVKRKAESLFVALEPQIDVQRNSIVPSVNLWHKVARDFHEVAHLTTEEKRIDEQLLEENFQLLEQLLGTFTGWFLAGLNKIEKIIVRENSRQGIPEAKEIAKIIAVLVRPQYQAYFFTHLKNYDWLIPLKDNRFFEDLYKVSDGYAICPRMKVFYLVEASKEKPTEVFGIIEETQVSDSFVRGRFLEAILNMPIEISAKGIKLVCGYLKDREWLNWYETGEPAAKLMVKFAECGHLGEALEIAKKLLELRVPEDSEKSKYGEDITGKFNSSDYEKLVSKHFNKIITLAPASATRLLIDVFARYLNEYGKKKDYEPSELYYVRIEQVDEILSYGRYHISLITKAICDGGCVVIENQFDKANELFERLEGLNRQIFTRIEMYLLRFITDKSQNDRINRLIGNKSYIEGYGYKNEYKQLLNDRFDDVSDEGKAVFAKWVEGQGLGKKKDWDKWFRETRDREPNDEDRKKYIARIKAEELHPVRERYKELFEKYLEESGKKEEDVKPRPRFWTGGDVDPTEGSQISAEEMAAMSVIEAIAAVNDPANWENKKNQHYFDSAKHSLAAIFKNDFKHRAEEYLGLDDSVILSLDVMFLEDVFDVIWMRLREDKEISCIEQLIRLMEAAVARYCTYESYRPCFLTIINGIEAILDSEKLRNDYVKGNIGRFWEIIEPLVKYGQLQDKEITDEDGKERASGEEDPVQLRHRSVLSQAFELTIRLGVICKNADSLSYDREFKKRIEDTLNYSAKEVKRSEVHCVFGLWLGQVHYINEEWFANNVTTLFKSEGGMWDAVWGTFVTWGKTSQKLFEFLCETGIYQQAIERIGQEAKLTHEKDVDKGLAGHLMIAFFNLWYADDKYGLMSKFLDKAPAKLRGYAANFLTSGFETLNAEDNKRDDRDEICSRLFGYWESRIAAMKSSPAENFEEAIQFAGWIKDAPFDRKKSLNLCYETLEITGGKVGDYGSGQDVVEGICAAAKANELLALNCLNIIASQTNWENWYSYKDDLDEFLKVVVKLPKEYANFCEIREEAIKLADTFGRKNIYDLKWVYEELKDRI